MFSLERMLRTNPADFVADQVRLGASNLDTVRAAQNERLLDPDQYRTLTFAYLDGINSALRRCFPDDAYRINLYALEIVAEHIPAREVDLDAERGDIMELIGLPRETTHVTTQEAYHRFYPYARYKGEKMEEGFYEKATVQMTSYIAESVRRGVTQHNPDDLERVIPMMRLLGYLHKAVEVTHYGCESEWDVMTRWAVDRENVRFTTVTEEEALARGEVTSKHMWRSRSGRRD